MVLASQMTRSEMTRRGMTSSRSRMPRWLWVTLLILVIGGGAMAWWAYGELTDGANVVRRAIGAVTLAYVARSLTSRSRSQ